MADPAPIHTNFSDWFRSADAGTDKDLLSRRWGTIARLVDCKKLSRDQDVQLVRYVNAGTAPKGSLDWLQKEFKTDDEFFVQDDENRRNELLALSGAIIAYYLTKDDSYSGKIGTQILTSTCSGLRTLTVSAPLFELAEKCVKQRSVLQRKIEESPDPAEIKWPPKGFTASLDAFNAGDPKTFKGPVESVAETVKSLIAQNKQLSESHKSMSKALECQREEIDMLWFVYNGYSQTGNKKFSELKKEERAAFVALELAIKTTSDIEVPSLQALLNRIDISDEAANLKSLVSATFEKVSIDKKDPILTPVHFALFCAHDIGKNGWHEKWKRETGLSIDTSLPLRKWSTQIYREALLLNSGEIGA